MRIYVASSWRNEAKQQATVEALRRAGHSVYDFRHPAPGNEGFGWRFCSPDPEALTGFDFDMTALKGAEATVLVLPCGRSAHLELGYAVGARQRTIVLLDDPMSEPELMYLMCSTICVTLDEVLAACVERRCFQCAIRTSWPHSANGRPVCGDFPSCRPASMGHTV